MSAARLRKLEPSRTIGTVELTMLRPEAAMALPARLRPSRSPLILDALAFLGLMLVSAPAARAQVADVVRPDAQGEFRTIWIAGPRGSTPQRFWLVVDRDPRGLLCRDSQGRAWIAIRYGSVLQLAEPEQQTAPQLIQGKPSLSLVVKPIDILYDVRFRERGRGAVCRVRANSSTVAPIQEESLEQSLIRP